jgi:hypothetical protein
MRETNHPSQGCGAPIKYLSLFLPPSSSRASLFPPLSLRACIPMGHAACPETLCWDRHPIFIEGRPILTKTSNSRLCERAEWRIRGVRVSLRNVETARERWCRGRGPGGQWMAGRSEDREVRVNTTQGEATEDPRCKSFQFVSEGEGTSTDKEQTGGGRRRRVGGTGEREAVGDVRG